MMTPIIYLNLAATLFTAAPSPSASLLPDSLKWDGKSFLTQTVEGRIVDGTVHPPHFDTLRFAAPGVRIDEESALGSRIRGLVEDTLAHAFGRAGRSPDFAYLSGVFRGTEKGILKGKVRTDPDGREMVQYYWESPAGWIQALRKLSDAGNRFQVSLSIIWVYQDRHSSNRYWAVVKQGWQTFAPGGRAPYRDDGFLFLNFDLDPAGSPRNLEVNYRLWFYNYKRPDRKAGLKRHELIARDIRGALDAGADVKVEFGRLEGDRWVRSAGERGISGIDRGLVNRMAADLVGGIKEALGE